MNANERVQKSGKSPTIILFFNRILQTCKTNWLIPRGKPKMEGKGVPG